MKSLVSATYAAFTMVMLGLANAANAQSAGPFYDNTIHQSAGDRDSRGYPKYYQRSGAAEDRVYRRAPAKQPRVSASLRRPRLVGTTGDDGDSAR
jgi:hypothetical protein